MEQMPKPTPPCKDCPDRTADCHGKCVLWLDYEAIRNAYYQSVRDAEVDKEWSFDRARKARYKRAREEQRQLRRKKREGKL